MGYVTSMQMAEKWGLTKRRVNSLCQDGSIEGAYKDGYRWMIPSDADKPSVSRNRKKDIKAGSGKRALPIGISDYKLAVSKYYYVDKTLLIKELLDYHPLVTLFTRPRRFGKTLNMDMLRVFFEKTKEDTSIYFKRTNIWKAGAEYRQEQGSYPVIYFSFKDIKYNTWEEMKINLFSVIQAEYRRHIYLLSSDKIADIDKQYIEKLLQGTLDAALWAGTLANLSLMLDLHYDVAPMILIDEYDTPIQQGYMKGFYEDVISFMRNFHSGGLKDNRHMSMAFLTGILRVAKESIFSGLNNLNVNSILENRYSEYFGFTEKEVAQILKDFGQPDKMAQVKEWYDGYRFGRTEIYNPWSVINYVDSEFFPKTFWQVTGSNEVIGEIVKESSDEVRANLRDLLTGKSVEAYVDTSVVYPEIKRNTSSIYSFLLMAGYLTIQSEKPLHDGNAICSLCIPNKEVVILYEKEILIKMEPIVPVSAAIIMQQALLTEDMDRFQGELQKFLMSAVSYHDVFAESFYHGLLLGMSAVMNQYYEISSNREAGAGRYDIQLKPRNRGYPGFVIEVKAVPKNLADRADMEEVLDELARQGIKQIKEMEYASELKQIGCRRIIGMAVAFFKKKCKVVCSEEIGE